MKLISVTNFNRDKKKKKKNDKSATLKKDSEDFIVLKSLLNYSKLDPLNRRGIFDTREFKKSLEERLRCISKQTIYKSGQITACSFKIRLFVTDCVKDKEVTAQMSNKM